VHEVLFRRAHRIAVTPFSRDLPPAPSLNGIIGAQDNDRSRWHEPRHNQAQQNLARLQRCPLGPIQDPVIVGKVPLPTQPHNPQTASDRPLPWSQQRSDHQHLGVQPDPIGKELRKGGEEHYHLCGQ
jgi:hypothetical protein